MTISAVITMYNRGELALQALASVKAQSRPPDEILVIDDGSAEEAGAVIREQGVRYYWQPNAGSSAARNTGWKLASSDWIAYLDCDDLWEKDKLVLQETAAHKDPSLEAVFGHAFNFAEPSELERFQSPCHRLGVAIPGWLPSAALVRKSLLETMGGFNPEVKNVEVVDWIMRLRRREARTLMLPETVLRRRLHARNKGHQSGAMQKDHFALLREWRATQSAAKPAPSG